MVCFIYFPPCWLVGTVPSVHAMFKLSLVKQYLVFPLVVWRDLRWNSIWRLWKLLQPVSTTGVGTQHLILCTLWVFSRNDETNLVFVCRRNSNCFLFFFPPYRETEYYDYGHGEAQENYESYGKTTVYTLYCLLTSIHPSTHVRKDMIGCSRKKSDSVGRLLSCLFSCKHHAVKCCTTVRQHILCCFCYFVDQTFNFKFLTRL